MNKTIFLLVPLVLILCLATKLNAQGNKPECYVNTSNEISFSSSNKELDNFFSWAKEQALRLSFEEDAVGLWYEAALPGREAFCMRDVSHQALGAHFLGLASHTKNMLYTFAENVTDARDWCSLWEITRHGTPAPADYLNDSEFWYNLPANFDILDCCFRMYQLTGDMAYVNDPVFLNFYKRTVYDYVKRWDIGIDKVMTRDRYMINPPDNNRRFKNCRGIPGYAEGEHGYIAHLDLMVTQLAAFEAYASFMVLRDNSDEAAKFFAKTDEVREFINTVWWDEEKQSYFTNVNKDHSMENKGFHRSIFHFGPIKDATKLRLIIQEMVDHLADRTANSIELLSHMPEILYKSEKPELATEALLSVLQQERREYPEASFGSIGAMVSGLMGIDMALFPERDSYLTGHVREQHFETKSRLTGQTKWAEIRNVPIKRNSISVRHDGQTKTTFTNSQGPQLQWRAYISGSYETLLLNGKPKKATTVKQPENNEEVSFIMVVVGAGESCTVEVPER